MVMGRFRNTHSVQQQYEIKFGAAGPTIILTHDQLLLATKDQVAYMEGIRA
jgi:hypothetical protein